MNKKHIIDVLQNLITHSGSYIQELEYGEDVDKFEMVEDLKNEISLLMGEWEEKLYH